MAAAPSRAAPAVSGYAITELLRDDGELALWRALTGGRSVLLVAAALERPARATVKRLEHEYELRDELEPEWAARPLALERSGGSPVLVLEDAGGAPLDWLGQASDPARFLRLGAAIAAALAHVHERGLVHKDVKPGNVLVDASAATARLTGFGIATRLPRERQT